MCCLYFVFCLLLLFHGLFLNDSQIATEALLRQVHNFHSSETTINNTDDILKQAVQLKCPLQTNLPLIDLNKVIPMSYYSSSPPQVEVEDTTTLCKNADEAIRLPLKVRWESDKYIASSILLTYVRRRTKFAKWIFEDKTLHVDLNQCDEVMFFLFFFIFPVLCQITLFSLVWQFDLTLRCRLPYLIAISVRNSICRYHEFESNESGKGFDIMI
jgi:hypothetical protein